MRIQELFYRMSSHKDGAKAGKVDKDQLRESKYIHILPDHFHCQLMIF